MEETISIQDIFKIVLKRWKLIILITLLVTSISGGISFYILTPIYQASTQILVNQRDSENKLDFNRLRNNIELINTYRVIIRSPVILDKVVKELSLKQHSEQLYQSVKVNSFEDSQIFSIIVEDSNPNQAVEIANSIAEIFQKEIPQIMNVDNVSILTRANMKDNPIPIKPNPINNMAIGVVIGIMVGVGFASLIEYLDKTVKESDEIDAYLGLPVIGVIHKMPREKRVGKTSKRTRIIQRTEGESVET